MSGKGAAEGVRSVSGDVEEEEGCRLVRRLVEESDLLGSASAACPVNFTGTRF